MPRHQRRRRLSAASLNASFNQDAEQTKQSSTEVSDLDVTFADLGENDDNAERCEARKHPSRRKSMMPVITPVRSSRRNVSTRSRRASPSPYLSSTIRRKQYTNEELVHIYKDCIVKAQQGKINQLNAWTLHLVDNIEEITDLNQNRQNDESSSQQQNAFARASHTIDAASKIYGYRVDSVHNKTYKVLGSIHQQNAGDMSASQMDGDDLAAEAKRKRRERNRNVGKATLCSSDKAHKLNETLKNLCVEVDALFHKTASCFDEGGAKGLLMNTLYVQNGCDIVFDSSTKIEQNEDITLNGIRIDEEQMQNEEAIQKECEWTTQLAKQSFGGFTQPIDTTSDDFDVSTQTEPNNFTIDIKWIETTSICPAINVFERQIADIANYISRDDDDGRRHSIDAMMFDAAPIDDDPHDDDNDVIMDMPDFTIGGPEEFNAQDLFHEELLTQAAAPHPHLMSMDVAAAAAGDNVEYVVGHNNGAMIGDMGVQPDLNNSMGFAFNHGQQIVTNLEREQEDINGEYGALHRGGIYKRGSMNLTAMNHMISKLENADFENLTSFFDTKKHGNWAGPDQWYHRRYLMTLKQNTKNNANGSRVPSASVSRGVTVDAAAATEPNEKKKKKKQSTRFDFVSIARGNLIDEAEFDEPQRSFNTLTQAVLDKNKKSYHTLPKDLQIKPDMFIKLFHRENYSVWKHWLRQHQLRMAKAIHPQAAEHPVGYEDGDMMMMNEEPQFLAQQAAAMAVIDDGDDADPGAFEYNYDNALDTSHFVPNLNCKSEDHAQFDFNLNGYDLIDMDPAAKVEKIEVGFATTAKKVNIRKLKLKLWDKIDNELIVIDDDDENDKENIQNNNNENEDVDMKEKMVTFQDTLNSLPSSISSAISVHMCFICLLHLANEKELQFVPKEVVVVAKKEEDAGQEEEDNKNGIIPHERGNFEIQYANAQSVFEKEAERINPVMVLGMN
eukprot:423597_1